MSYRRSYTQNIWDDFEDGQAKLREERMSTLLFAQMPHEYHATVVKKGGTLAGKQLQLRQVIDYAHIAGFRDDDLVIAAMVCGAESWRYTRAFNDNTDGSRDVGLMEINIPKSAIGTAQEEALYDPANNFARAFAMWKTRKWQPWVSYNTGVYLHDTYRAWALLGIMNHYAEIFDKATAQQTALKVPLISVHQFKTLYPNVVLG